MMTSNSDVRIFCSRLFDGETWRSNQVLRICDGVIREIKKAPDQTLAQQEASAQKVFAQNVGDRLQPPYAAAVHCVSPGLIDNHTHGGDGYLVLDPSGAHLEEWLVKLRRRGLSAVVLAAYGSKEQMRALLQSVDRVMKKQENGWHEGTRLLGLHLEGPFLSEKRPGSMLPGTLLAPSVTDYREITVGFEHRVREITLAPEEKGAEELVRYLCAQNVRVLAGHTDCTLETAVKAFSWGVGAVCHTFNACRPIHHREPGIITAALNRDEIRCEVIGDLVHLHPEIIRLILRCKRPDQVMLISDSVSTTGLPDGVYDELGTAVCVKNGESRVLSTGDLNGGGCYISESVRRLVSAGFAPETVLPMATAAPARWLGLSGYGIAEGSPADLTLWDEKFRCVGSMAENRLFLNETAE